MKRAAGRILVVDDEESVRGLCVATLERMGYAVEAAGSAAEAWDHLNARGYDCVLTDISMPGSMDGAALTEEVRGRFPSTDILIMTGNPNLTTAVSTLKHGALDYLSKPFAPAVLESAVTRCFERRRLSAELDMEKTMRLELTAAYAELQKTERAKDAFISVLSHELRTPLTIAIAATEILDKDQSPARGVLEMLRTSLARENEIIEDLLLFSRLETGGGTANREEVRPEEMIRGLVENYRSVWEEKEIRIELDFAAGQGSLLADPALLRTAFKHLLLNAIRFNMKGGGVRVEGRRSDERFDVVFSDTGIGIAPEQLARVFDRFYQVAEHMSRHVGGLGLGLAIVRRIVESHGGYVTADSRDGGGSKFRVSLPLRPPAATKSPQKPKVS